MKNPIDRNHETIAEQQSEHWRNNDEGQRVYPFAENQTVAPSLGESRSGVAANQGVRRADGQLEIPGE